MPAKSPEARARAAEGKRLCSKRRYERRRASGQCVLCGGPGREGLVKCEPCQHMATLKLNEWRQLKRAERICGSHVG